MTLIVSYNVMGRLLEVYYECIVRLLNVYYIDAIRLYRDVIIEYNVYDGGKGPFTNGEIPKKTLNLIVTE